MRSGNTVFVCTHKGCDNYGSLVSFKTPQEAPVCSGFVSWEPENQKLNTFSRHLKGGCGRVLETREGLRDLQFEAAFNAIMNDETVAASLPRELLRVI